MKSARSAFFVYANRAVYVAFKAVKKIFRNSEQNKKLLTSAQRDCSTPFFRCRSMTPQQHLV